MASWYYKKISISSGPAFPDDNSMKEGAMINEKEANLKRCNKSQRCICFSFLRPEKFLVKKRNEKLQSILLESPHGRFFFQKEIHYTNPKVCASKKVFVLLTKSFLSEVYTVDCFTMIKRC